MKQQTYEMFAELTAREWADEHGEAWDELDKNQRRAWKQQVKASPDFQKWAAELSALLQKGKA